MSALLYGVALQWKLDIRSKTLLITCYVVPLLFFALMGGIFTSITPDAKNTLIQSMTVMGVSMGALVGLPPSLLEIYGSDSKKIYKANGVPLYLGLVSIFLSAFIHLSIMCAILFLIAPVAFHAALPVNLPLFLGSLALFIAVSCSIGCVLGLIVKNQAKLTMISQVVFLPSIMLSGIMFPSEMLPKPLEYAGRIFPAAWGYKAMTADRFSIGSLWPMAMIAFAAVILCGIRLKRLESE